MRSGLPVDQILEAGVGVEVNVARGGRVLAVNVPVKDVTLDWSSNASIAGSLSFLAPLDWEPTEPKSPLNNFGQRVQVFALMESRGTVTRTEIGWFQIASWAPESGNLKVTAVDLWTVLVDSPADLGSSPPAGATLLSELQRLCNIGDGASLPVILDGVANVTVPRTLQWGVDRAAAVTDLCTAYGLQCGVRPDGYLHVWPIRDGRSPVIHYTAADLLQAAPRASMPRRPNRFTVVGSSGSGDDAQRWIAKVSTDSDPYEPAGYGIVTSRTELSSATSQAQVNAATQQAMRDALSVAETRSLELVLDPRIEAGDIISLITDEGEPLTGRITDYSMTLDDPSKTMRVDMEVLAW
jgi:hypothetical protein